MAVLCWMNTKQYSPRIGSLYATCVSLGPPESWTVERKWYLDLFRIFCRAQSLGDRPTNHGTRSFTISGIYVRSKGKEKYLYTAPFVYYVYLKALRHGSQYYLQTQFNTPCLPFLRKRSAFTRRHHPRGRRHPISAYYSSIDPKRLKGWVGLVGWSIAVYPHKWSLVRQASRKTGKVRWPKADVLPLCHEINCDVGLV